MSDDKFSLVILSFTAFTKIGLLGYAVDITECTKVDFS